jgi:hypothetical protein
MMKQANRKPSPLMLVRSLDEQARAVQEGRSAPLQEYFDARLNSVAPTLLPKQDLLKEKSENFTTGRRSLTTKDIIRVNRATIRESSVPRHWPPDVVLTFLAADVIKPTKH